MALGLQNFRLKTLYNLPTYTDNIPNIAMKKRLLLLAILPLSLYAADVPPNVKPELQVNTAEPQQPEAHNIPAEQTNRPSEKIIDVDADTLLANTELLARAMYSAVVAHNIPGIKAVLPIYEQWPEHDRAMARYAKGLLAQSEGRAAEAVGHYRRFIAEQPDASAVRWQLATALFEDKQNEAAADQFDKLQTESLPPALQERIETYRKALRERDLWQFNAGLNITREQNINQAPSQRRLGNHLSDEQCRAVRLVYPDDDCFRGWTFPEPIEATAVHYQIGAEKKWSLPRGFYATAGADHYGKIYPKHTNYNDLTTRFSAGIGYADQRSDIGITLFHERRFYGNDPYTYTNGARLHYNHWWQPKLQTLSAFEAGRLKNSRREHSDNTSQLLSNSIVYYRNARQYWVAGIDLYRERNRDDKSDSFNRYALRTTWGQEWPKGLSTVLRLSTAQRRYQAPGFFSNEQNRRDKEASASLSVWHRALHFKGITPRLTIAHNKTWSNDKFYEYGKTKMFVELSKTF